MSPLTLVKSKDRLPDTNSSMSLLMPSQLSQAKLRTVLTHLFAYKKSLEYCFVWESLV